MLRLRTALVVATIGAAVVFVWMLLAPTNDRGQSALETDAPRRQSASDQPTGSRSISAPLKETERIEVADSRSADDSGHPHIIGRIVTADGEPVPNAPMRWSVVFSRGTFLGGMGATADEEGKFDLELGKVAYTSATLEVESVGNAGSRTLELQGPFQGTRDLGDVALAAFKTVWFRVLKTDGTPIAGALVQELPRGSGFEETKADGSGSIEVDPKVTSLRFAARGFQIVDVPIPAGDELLTVKLNPSSSLTVHVTTSAGDPMPDTTRIRIDSKEPLCDLAMTDPLWNALGNSVHNNERRDGSMFTGHTVTLTPVRAGARMTIVVTEQTTNEQMREEVEVAAGEARVVKFTLSSAFGPLNGRVLGERGEPICNATVLFGKDDITRKSDEKGEFDYGAVRAGLVDLRVSSVKHAFWRAADHRVEPVASPLIIRLEGGLPVKVKLVDDDGAPVKGASVYALDRFGTTDGEGQVHLAHLPCDNVNIETFFGGVRSTFAHNTSNPTATLHLEPLKK